MSFKAKIIVTGLNASFLLVSLLYPDTTTPLITLITIISTILWAFESKASKYVHEKVLVAYIGFATLLSALCVVLGFSGEINKDGIGTYEYTFREEIVFFGNASFDYIYIAIIAFFAVTILMLAELNAIFAEEKIKKITGGNNYVGSCNNGNSYCNNNRSCSGCKCLLCKRSQ